jgi:hypothetical protein
MLERAARRLVSAAVPARLRPRLRRVAERRGWVAPAPSIDDDPFQYPFWQILARDSSAYPHYLWGTMCAAALGAALGHPRISVIEFGVAGGNGLIELERVSAWVAGRSGVAIDVYGFDTGSGLPQPRDYRDLPNLWSEGHFPMDSEGLRRRLTTARLELGPVGETVPAFLSAGPAPIGFVVFDLDLYSSTVDAFGVFGAGRELLLPRVACYFDDIIGFSHGDFTGERLAIAEFNQSHDTRKISKLYGLRYVLLQDKWWTDMMYMFHLFDHPDYNRPDRMNRRTELPLRDG